MGKKSKNKGAQAAGSEPTVVRPYVQERTETRFDIEKRDTVFQAVVERKSFRYSLNYHAVSEFQERTKQQGCNIFIKRSREHARSLSSTYPVQFMIFFWH